MKDSKRKRQRMDKEKKNKKKWAGRLADRKISKINQT